MQYAWLLPIVAVLVAVAIIVTLIAGGHLFRPRVIPVTPHLGAASTCPTWGYIPGGTNAPSGIKMTSSTTGWAPGDLRTTDGGSTWTDVSPRQLRADEPYLPGQQTAYPPNYTDFFLDSRHAWLARSYESDAACIDHVSVFATRNGGQAWRASTPISLQLNAAAQPQLALTFFDATHGWLLISSQSKPLVSILYASTDGGATWRLVTAHGPGCSSLVFSTLNVGWSSCGDGPLFGTRDGGATWFQEPAVSGSLPVFFDADHGATVGQNQNQGRTIYSTSDGGQTWKATPITLPGGFEPYAVAVGLAGAHDYRVFVTPPNWFKGGTPTDWLYQSADAGATWQLVQRDTPVSSAIRIDFIDPTHGWVLQGYQGGGPNQILVTDDGGHTWTALKVRLSTFAPTRGSTSIAASTIKPSNGSVYFASSAVAWELTRPPDGQTMVVLRTADGGAHWRIWGLAPGGQLQVVSVGENEIVLSDYAGNVIRSADGAQWATEPLPTGAGSVTFLPDLQRGWAYGTPPTPNLPPAKGGPPSRTAVWATSDGGATWRETATGYIGDGSGPITFWSPTNGAVLQGPVAWLTADGGAGWHKVQLAQLPPDAFAQDGTPTFFDADHGILPITGGQQVLVSRTSDGGRTWSVADATSGCTQCAPVVFLDDQHWISLRSGVQVSGDGGKTWAAVSTTLGDKKLSGIELVPGHPGAAVVFGQGTYATMTTDWGVHWRAISLPTLYASYTGLDGSGGWSNPRACQCI